MAVNAADTSTAKPIGAGGRRTLNKAMTPPLHRVEVRRKAQRLLGEPAWMLVCCYGRLMEGPHSGRYVSALSCEEQLRLARRLRAGATVAVHLMHRHRSGNYESSSTRWTLDGLVMVYADREVPA